MVSKTLTLYTFKSREEAVKFSNSVNEKVNTFLAKLRFFCESKGVKMYMKIDNQLMQLNEALLFLPSAKVVTETVKIMPFIYKDFFKVVYFSEPKYSFLFVNSNSGEAESFTISDFGLLYINEQLMLEALQGLYIFKEHFEKTSSGFNIPECKFINENSTPQVIE